LSSQEIEPKLKKLEGKIDEIEAIRRKIGVINSLLFDFHHIFKPELDNSLLFDFHDIVYQNLEYEQKVMQREKEKAHDRMQSEYSG